MICSSVDKCKKASIGESIEFALNWSTDRIAVSKGITIDIPNNSKQDEINDMINTIRQYNFCSGDNMNLNL